MPPAISVQNLGKVYRIGSRAAHDTLRDTIAAVFNPARRKEAHHATSDTFWALKDVSFDVEPGDVFGIIGRNGAGKSTILKILSRITEPTRGRVELRGRIASLLEVGTGFHPELSGRENIFLNGAILGMKRQEIQRKFDEIIAFAEIEKFLDTPVKRYSSGMYVRLAFAVAAHLDPEILIIDEVLAVGDDAFQKKCVGKIGSVAQQGRTVLFVSHNMVAVKTMCNRAILIHEGSIADEGSPARVVNSYLGAGRISRAEIRWNDPMTAPGLRQFRLVATRVRNGAGEITSELSSDESFTVEIEYMNLSPGSSLGATVLLFNESGTNVFSSLSNQETSWHGRSFPRGVFRSTCHIPGNLLAEGQFDVSVIIWCDNYSVTHREDYVVGFEVHDTAATRRDYHGGWSGVVRPMLKWETQLVDSPEHEAASTGSRG